VLSRQVLSPGFSAELKKELKEYCKSTFSFNSYGRVAEKGVDIEKIFYDENVDY
jgi:hypothetical protein